MLVELSWVELQTTSPVIDYRSISAGDIQQQWAASYNSTQRASTDAWCKHLNVRIYFNTTTYETTHLLLHVLIYSAIRGTGSDKPVQCAWLIYCGCVHKLAQSNPVSYTLIARFRVSTIVYEVMNAPRNAPAVLAAYTIAYNTLMLHVATVLSPTSLLH